MLLLGFVVKVTDKGIIDILKRYMYPFIICPWKIMKCIKSHFFCLINSIQHFSFTRKTNTKKLADSNKFSDILQIQLFLQYMNGNMGGRWKGEIFEYLK